MAPPHLLQHHAEEEDSVVWIAAGLPLILNLRCIPSEASRLRGATIPNLMVAPCFIRVEFFPEVDELFFRMPLIPKDKDTSILE
jgi:hypothetical protein